MDDTDEKTIRESIPVHLPLRLYAKIRKRIKGTEFNSIQEYVIYVLEQVISSMESEEEEKVFSTEDEQIIKNRLRSLGYLD